MWVGCASEPPTKKDGLVGDESLSDRVRPVVEGFIAPWGVKILDVEYNGKKLTVRLDRADRLPTLEDCQNLTKLLSNALEVDLDVDDRLGETYTLEVTTPGVREELTEDFEFRVFKSFHVTVTTTDVFKSQNSFEGSLVGRTETCINISQKGRILKIPRQIVESVVLTKDKTKPAPES